MAHTLSNVFQELLKVNKHYSESSINILHRLCDIMDADMVGSKSNTLPNGFPSALELTKFVEDCLDVGVNDCVISFSFKLFSRCIHHGVDLPDRSKILDRVLSYFTNKTDGDYCEQASIVVSNAAIDCFISVIQQKDIAPWILLSHKEILPLVWSEITRQRSIYLIKTCSKFIVELIGFLDNRESRDLPVVDSELSTHSLLNSLWSLLDNSTNDTSINAPVLTMRIVSLNRIDVELTCLDILRELSEREICIKQICTYDGWLRRFLDMLGSKDKSLIIVQIFVCIIESQYANDLSTRVIDKFLSLLSHKTTFVSAHKSALNFIISTPNDREMPEDLASVVLTPLWVVTGATKKCSNLAILEVTREVIANKSSCTAILCDLFSVAPDSVTDVFRHELCCGVMELLSHISSAMTHISCDLYVTHLSRNTRVLTSLLRFLVQMNDVSGPFQRELPRRLVDVAENVEMSSSTLSFLCQTLIKYLPSHASTQSMIHSDIDGGGECSEGGVWPRLANWLLAGMCDPRWEVRDTLVEFVGHVAQVASANTEVRAWIARYNIVPNVWSTLADSESYVRAAVLKSLMACLHGIPDILLEAVVSQNALSTAVVKVLTTDHEAFPRRAAVDLLSALYHHSSPPHADRPVICDTLYGCVVKDLDWEVKLRALRFWATVIDLDTTQHSLTDEVTTCEPDTYLDLCSSLLHGKCLQSVVAAMTDCDPSVQDKAIDILLAFTTAVHNVLPADGDSSLNASDVIEVTSECCLDTPHLFTPRMVTDVLHCVRRLYEGRAKRDNSDCVKSVVEDLMTALTSAAEVECLSDQDDGVVLDCY